MSSRVGVKSLSSAKFPDLIHATSPYSFREVKYLHGEEFIKFISNSPIWVWTSSALRLFRRCKRKFYWKYILRLTPRTTPAALQVGTLFHESIAKWYAGWPMKRIAKELIDPSIDRITEEEDLYGAEEFDKLEQSMRILKGMLTGYTTHYASDLKRWKIDSRLVEVPFAVHFPGLNFIYKGKVDGIVKTISTGKHSVIEHKTARTIDEGYIGRLPVDTQVRSYILGATEGVNLVAKSPPNEVIYDVVKKTQIRKKAGESWNEFDERVKDTYLNDPSQMFYRESLKFSPTDIEIFKQELFSTHEDLMKILNSRDPYPGDPRAWGINDGECHSFFKPCTFISACTNCLNADNALAFRQRDTMHAELDEPTEE